MYGFYCFRSQLEPNNLSVDLLSDMFKHKNAIDLHLFLSLLLKIYKIFVCILFALDIKLIRCHLFMQCFRLFLLESY